MKYILRNEILPAYYQRGHATLQNPVFIGESTLLSSDHITALHYHNCIEFGICLSGSGEMHIENRIYQFSAGDISIVNADVPHLSKANTKNECTWIWMFVEAVQLLMDDGGQISKSLILDVDECYNGVFHPDKYPRLALLIDMLRHSKASAGYEKTEYTILVGHILSEAIRIGNVDKKGNKLPVLTQLKPALLFIRENYMDPQCMTAKKIAGHCGLSVSQFRNLFKRNIGMTLPQYINQTRLSSAINLLLTTNESITNIATESGFYEISYFNRIFRKTFGMSPKEMRRTKSETTIHLSD